MATPSGDSSSVVDAGEASPESPTPDSCASGPSADNNSPKSQDTEIGEHDAGSGATSTSDDAAVSARALSAAKLAAQTVERQLKVGFQKKRQESAPSSVTKPNGHRRAATVTVIPGGQQPGSLHPHGKSTGGGLPPVVPTSPLPQVPTSPPPRRRMISRSRSPQPRGPKSFSTTHSHSSSSLKAPDSQSGKKRITPRWRRSRRTQSTMITSVDPTGAPTVATNATANSPPAAPLKIKKGAKSLPRSKRRALSTLMTSAKGAFGSGGANPMGALSSSSPPSPGSTSLPNSPVSTLKKADVEALALARPTSPPPRSLPRGSRAKASSVASRPPVTGSESLPRLRNVSSPYASSSRAGESGSRIRSPFSTLTRVKSPPLLAVSQSNPQLLAGARGGRRSVSPEPRSTLAALSDLPPPLPPKPANIDTLARRQPSMKRAKKKRGALAEGTGSGKKEDKLGSLRKRTVSMGGVDVEVFGPNMANRSASQAVLSDLDGGGQLDFDELVISPQIKRTRSNTLSNLFRKSKAKVSRKTSDLSDSDWRGQDFSRSQSISEISGPMVSLRGVSTIAQMTQTMPVRGNVRPLLPRRIDYMAGNDVLSPSSAKGLASVQEVKGAEDRTPPLQKSLREASSPNTPLSAAKDSDEDNKKIARAETDKTPEQASSNLSLPRKSLTDPLVTNSMASKELQPLIPEEEAMQGPVAIDEEDTTPAATDESCLTSEMSTSTANNSQAVSSMNISEGSAPATRGRSNGRSTVRPPPPPRADKESKSDRESSETPSGPRPPPENSGVTSITIESVSTETDFLMSVSSMSETRVKSASVFSSESFYTDTDTDLDIDVAVSLRSNLSPTTVSSGLPKLPLPSPPASPSNSADDSPKAASTPSSELPPLVKVSLPPESAPSPTSSHKAAVTDVTEPGEEDEEDEEPTELSRSESEPAELSRSKSEPMPESASSPVSSEGTKKKKKVRKKKSGEKKHGEKKHGEKKHKKKTKKKAAPAPVNGGNFAHALPPPPPPPRHSPVEVSSPRTSDAGNSTPPADALASRAVSAPVAGGTGLPPMGGLKGLPPPPAPPRHAAIVPGSLGNNLLRAQSSDSNFVRAKSKSAHSRSISSMPAPVSAKPTHKRAVSAVGSLNFDIHTPPPRAPPRRTNVKAKTPQKSLPRATSPPQFSRPTSPPPSTGGSSMMREHSSSSATLGSSNRLLALRPKRKRMAASIGAMSPTDRQAIMKPIPAAAAVKSPNPAGAAAGGKKKSLSMTRPRRGHGRHKSVMVVPGGGGAATMPRPQHHRASVGSAPPPLPPKPAYMLTNKFEWDDTAETKSDDAPAPAGSTIKRTLFKGASSASISASATTASGRR